MYVFVWGQLLGSNLLSQYVFVSCQNVSQCNFFTVYVCVCTYPGLYWSVLLHAFTGVYFYTQIDNLCLMYFASLQLGAAFSLRSLTMELRGCNHGVNMTKESLPSEHYDWLRGLSGYERMN